MSVVEWLESPEGERWSRKTHKLTGIAHLLVSVKDDEDYAPYSAGMIWVA